MAFNHFDNNGNAWMVDVSSKKPTLREACAEAVVHMGPDILAHILDKEIAKGDVFQVARLAGISAVKKTSDLIPLAHPLAIHHAAVEFVSDAGEGSLSIRCTVKAEEKTGVEMEAMTGATIAALTVYDMCKALDKGISLGPVHLLFKSGGKSGTYQRQT